MCVALSVTCFNASLFPGTGRATVAPLKRFRRVSRLMHSGGALWRSRAGVRMLAAQE